MLNLIRKTPRPILIMGSGRSGTSLFTGSVVRNYYFAGEKPQVRNDESNPKGFYEDYDVNFLNDRLLDDNGASMPGKIDKDHKYKYGGWVSKLVYSNPDQLKISPEQIDQIKKLTNFKNFCFKDPRFSYTFPIWESIISREDLKLIVVFRSPGKTANSIVKEPTPMSAGMTIDDALEVWYHMYKSILDRERDNMIFIHFDQILELGGKINEIEDYLRIKFDRSFVDKKLNRSADIETETKYQDMYSKLKEKANYNEE